MLRSLAAVIIAVIFGLAVAKFVEGAFGALTQSAQGSFSYNFVLIGSWFFGAFTASVAALLIGRRWQPLGGLAAGAILLASVVTLLSFPLVWWLWPSALVFVSIGFLAAAKLTGATMQQQIPAQKETLFDD